jgi:hypothetical protein
MGLKIGDLYQNGTSWLTDSSISKQIFTSPINTAILIVLLIMLIIAYHYSDVDDAYVKLLKVGISAGVVTLLTMFMHDTVIDKMYKGRDNKSDEKIIFGSHAHKLDRRADIRPKMTVEDLPDLETNSSDETSVASAGSVDDILAAASAPKLEDLMI